MVWPRERLAVTSDARCGCWCSKSSGGTARQLGGNCADGCDEGRIDVHNRFADVDEDGPVGARAADGGIGRRCSWTHCRA